ncbi:MFS transporter (macronuclear) [Tetrahymena thermophila SB210]|uniref:Hexose transporter 1 n=1 Tax=Tetrahymena thermophila (strain SB210) TaxID=312017 RepID=I7LU14_TETTS|nr:MFS transporter [Tetrahymena thermophila SB210]EAR87706.1 MFS transporter [Tetrahymena thermophila SB210]|eukprot:XP_001007951.1 MFS transporter [Tetrahymena thermophila SB210]
MDRQININKPRVFAMASNICLASLYFGYNIATYNSASQVIISLNGWRGTDKETLYPSLITSSLAAGCIISAPVAVNVLKIFKNNLRKASMLLDILTIVACVIQLVDTHVANLIVGRFLAGLIIGLNCTYVSSFIAEVSPTQLRGVTGCINQLLICFGICVVFLLGLILPSKQALIDDPTYDNQVNWRIVVGFPVIFTVLRFINFILFFRYDTPCELYKQGKLDDLKNFLRSIYREESEIDIQIELIKEQVNATSGSSNKVDIEKAQNPAQPANPATNSDISSTNKEKKNEHRASDDLSNGSEEHNYAKESFKRRWLLGLLMCIGQQLTCINGVNFYSNQIFEDANQADNAYYYTIGLGFIQFFACLVSVFIVDKKGRRPMMLWGTVVLVISLALIAILLSFDLFIPSFLAICLFLIAFSLSQGPLVWAYQGEMLEQKALQINTCVLWIFTLVIGIIFPYMAQYIKAGGTFAIFAAITFLFLIYYKKEFIETKGKSRIEIYREFCNKPAVSLKQKQPEQMNAA